MRFRKWPNISSDVRCSAALMVAAVAPGFTTKNVLGPIHPEWLGSKDLEDMKKAFLPGALDGYIDNGKLYAVGGGNASGVLSTVQEYDPATDTWATRTTMPSTSALPAYVTTSKTFTSVGDA